MVTFSRNNFYDLREFLRASLILSGDSVTRWIYFYEDLNIFISTLCVCADVFQGLSKAFTTLTIIKFLFDSVL
jgi:hypothetical protein